MKKFLYIISTLFILVGCGNKIDEKQNNDLSSVDSGAICIAVQPTFESLPLIVADDNNLFNRCGVKVILKMYTSQSDCDTAVAKGYADAMITDIVRAAFWERENKKTLNHATWTNTHYMLISSKKSRVKELTQMTDKLMAVTRYSVSDVLADSAMMRAKKTPEEMFKVQINDQEIRLNMLLENKMDAAFLQHPYAAEAMVNGGNVLMHGGKSNSGILTFVESVDSADVKNILKSYDEACTQINAKGVMHYAPLVEKYMRKDIRQWKKQIGEIKFKKSHPIDHKYMDKAKQWVRDN